MRQEDLELKASLDEMVIAYFNKDTRYATAKDSDYSPRLSKIKTPDKSMLTVNTSN